MIDVVIYLWNIHTSDVICILIDGIVDAFSILGNITIHFGQFLYHQIRH